jgi:hypothetical protein
MPTGYTARIEDGSITTGKEFLMLCARAFGACVEMRDEPLSVPVPFEFSPSPYYKRRIKEAEENLCNLLSLTVDDAQAMLDKEYQDNQKRYAEAVERREKIRQKYKAVRDYVEQWEPPTMEHKKLKKFALNQIAISGDDGWSLCETEKPKENAQEWLQAKIDYERKYLEKYQKDWQEEVERTNNKNKWLSALRESLS